MGTYQMPRRFSEREAAEFLGVQYQTLKNWRTAGRGPSFYRVGTKIVFDARDLEAWMSQRRIEPERQPVTA